MTAENFAKEVLPVKNKLFRFANRYMHDAAEAEDIVQEVFLKLWSKKNKLKEIRSIEAFAMTTTRNICLDKLKSLKNKTSPLEENQAPRVENTPYEQADLKDRVYRIRQIIETLPEQQKTIIHLRDIENYEFEEIAEITQLSLNTIRVNLSRARKKVRDSLLKIQNYGISSN